MSGNQWGPPPGQYPQQPPQGQGQFGGQPWQGAPYGGPPPQGAPYQGMPQGGQPQFGWGAPPGGPQPPKKGGGGAKAVFVVLGVVILGGVGLVGVANALNDGDSSSTSTRPNSSTKSRPTYRPPTVARPTRTVATRRPTTTRTTTRPTAPRSSRSPKKKPGPSNSDLVVKNKIYAAGVMKSVNCKESRSRPTNVAGAKANYKTLLACLNRSWPALVTKSGASFQPPNVRVFSGTVSTPCGTMRDTGPPFYCPSNQTIYMNLTEDIGNYNRYSQSYQKVWARMWMMHQFAHEYGHHVQNRTGILSAYHQLRHDAPTQAKELELSRRVELQASCFGDIFIGANRQSYPVTGESLRQWKWLIRAWTDLKNDHGDGKNHQYWATRAFNSRNTNVCNTFVAPAAKVQ